MEAIEEIRGLLQSHNEYVKMILFATFFMIIVTLAVHFFTEKLRFPKYMPGLIAFIAGVFMVLRLLPNLYIKSYLGDIVVAMVTVGVGLIGLLFGMILGVIYKRERFYNNDDEIEY